MSALYSAMRIILTYPWYFILFALIIAIFFTAILYFRNTDKFPVTLQWLLSILRFFGTFLILLLLLNPLAKQFQKKLIKPLIIFAQDNSESIVSGNDSLSLRNSYHIFLKKIKQDIGNKANILSISFGTKVSVQDSFDFSEKTTNFNKLFRFIEQNYKNSNLAAVIVSSDGLMNRGRNPLYETYNIKVPVYFLANGDTSFHTDVAIDNVAYNRIVPVNNPYPIKIKVNASLANKQETILRIFDNKKEISKQKIKITGNLFYTTVPFTLKSTTKGIHTIRIVIDSIQGESNLNNNYTELKIDIIDTKQKILIIGNTPHPDIALIQNALKSNLNFNVTTITVGNVNPDSLINYNLIILHQLPSYNHSITGIIKKIKKLKLPVFYIIGTQTDITKLNNSQSFIQIDCKKNLWNNAKPILVKSFDEFILPDNFTDFLEIVPPLKTPFGNIKNLNDALIVLTQKLKNIETQKPLLELFSNKETKVGFLMGENIWRWGIYDYKEFNTHTHIYRLINNVARFLSIKIKKNNLLIISKSIYPEDEKITIEAEYYNEILEKTNTPDLKLTITEENKNNIYTYDFLKINNKYMLNINNLPAGNYYYKAEMTYHEKQYIRTGYFTVKENRIEQTYTRANFSFMKQLSEKFSGNIFYPQQWTNVSDSILSQHNLVSISKTKEKLNSLINWKFIFFIIIGFFSLEWLLRKYFGNI